MAKRFIKYTEKNKFRIGFWPFTMCRANLTARLSQSQEFPKDPEICANKYTYSLFCCVFDGKMLHVLKILAKGKWLSILKAFLVFYEIFSALIFQQKFWAPKNN